MPLPKLDYPAYEIKLFSKEKPIKFRPFLVKEQKILMMAVESGNIDTVIDAMKQIINNCSLEKIENIDSLPLIDIEQFFLNLRARSMGEIIDVFFKCKNIVEGAECNMVINIGIDLLKDVEVLNNTKSNKIMFTDKVGVLMKYPTIEQIRILIDDEETPKNKLIIDCLDKIFDDEEVYNAKDASEEELIQFLEELSSTDYEKLSEFIENSPKVYYNRKHTCSKCGSEHSIVLEGLGDFFI